MVGDVSTIAPVARIGRAAWWGSKSGRCHKKMLPWCLGTSNTAVGVLRRAACLEIGASQPAKGLLGRFPVLAPRADGCLCRLQGIAGKAWSRHLFSADREIVRDTNVVSRGGMLSSAIAEPQLSCTMVICFHPEQQGLWQPASGRELTSSFSLMGWTCPLVATGCWNLG